MSDKPKVEFFDNVQTWIKFEYDKPKTGEGNYGPWWLFGVKVYEGKQWVEKTMFPTEFLYKTFLLAGINKKDMYGVTLKQDPDDKKKKFWEIVVKDGPTHTSYDLQDNAVEIPAESKQSQNAPQDTTNQETYQDVINDYFALFDEMRDKLQERDIMPDQSSPFVASVWIECRRNNIPISRAEQPEVIPDENVPEAMDAPVDDLPF